MKYDTTKFTYQEGFSFYSKNVNLHKAAVFISFNQRLTCFNYRRKKNFISAFSSANSIS